MADEVVTILPDAVHVYPLFGREHILTDSCWCHPQPDPQEPTLLIHNQEH